MSARGQSAFSITLVARPLLAKIWGRARGFVTLPNNTRWIKSEHPCYTRRVSAAQLRINIHTRSRVISIAHPVLTIPYVWRVTHEYINEGLKQGLKI